MTDNPLAGKIRRYFFEETDPVRLDAFRVSLGLAMFFYFFSISRGWSVAGEWLTNRGFHVSGTLLPSMPVASLLPVSWLPWFGALFFASLILWILGFHPRTLGCLVLGLVSYVSFADVLSNYSVNRLFMIGLAVLCCARRGSSQTVWPIRILQMVLVLQYFMAGWAKVFYGDWLRDPLTLWSQLQVYYMNGFCAWVLPKVPLKAWSAMQYGTLLFELSAPFLFFIRKLRPVGLICGAVFHLIIALLMQDLIYFGLQMMSFYVLFVPEAALHKIRVYKRLSVLLDF